MPQHIIAAPFGHVAIIEDIDGIKVTLSPVSLSDRRSETNTECVATISAAIKTYLQDPNQYQADAINIDTLSGTLYQKRVWKVIASIAPGTTVTYTEVAEVLQSCPRAVANACGANRIPILIPCHRVVAKLGIGGFMRSHPNGVMIKRWLLEHEGLYV